MHPRHLQAAAVVCEHRGMPAFQRLTSMLRTWDMPATRNACHPPQTFGHGMREFGIYDNNGGLLQFGTPVCDGTAASPVHVD